MDTNTCPHCRATLLDEDKQERVVEGGRMYARICSNCGKTMNVRPRLDTDPPAAPPEFTDKQIKYMQFFKEQYIKEGHRNRVVTLEEMKAKE